jgi:WD40 repeat protein
MPALKTNYHSTLATYFAGKPLYLDEPTQKKPNTRKLIEQPWQQTKGEMWDEVTETLCDFNFIYAKAIIRMIYNLLFNYSHTLSALIIDHPQRTTLDLLFEAIKISSPTLIRDPYQIASQLYGRLIAFTNQENINSFCESIISKNLSPWFRSLRPSLTSPGGPIIHILKGHQHDVTSLAFSPDEKQLVSSSRDNTIRVWDVVTGECLKILEGHTHFVEQVVVTVSGSRIISVSADNTIKVWDVGSGSCLKTVRFNKDCILYRLAVSNDEKYIATLNKGNNCSISVLELNSGRVIINKGCNQFNRGSIFFSTLDPYIITIVDSGGEWRVDKWSIFLLNRMSHEFFKERDLDGAEALLYDRFAAITYGDYIEVRDLISKERIFNSNVRYSGAFRAISFDSKINLITGSDKPIIQVWDVKNGKCLQIFHGHRENIISLSVTKDGKIAASGSLDKLIIIWNLTKEDVYFIYKAHNDLIWSISGSLDTHRVLTYSRDYIYKIWNIDTLECLHTINTRAEGIKRVALSPKDLIIGVAFDNNSIKLFDYKLKEYFHILEGHENEIMSIDFSPDGSRLLSWSKDKTIRIWDCNSGKCLNILIGHSDTVLHARFSHDASMIVSTSTDMSVKVWDSRNSHCVFTSPAFASISLLSFCFHPIDNNILIASEIDSAGFIYNYITGKRKNCTLEELNSMLYSDNINIERDTLLYNIRNRQIRFTVDGEITSYFKIMEDMIIIGEDSGQLHFLKIDGMY